MVRFTAMSDGGGDACARARVIGRYALFDEIAVGGVASVRLGKMLGPVGFTRTVAIKCLHPQYAKEPAFAAMFVDEARLATRIQHPNVVPTLDVIATSGELFLVLEYVHGESLANLTRTVRERGGSIPPAIAVSIFSGLLQGLASAHAAKGPSGEPLRIVHRDVSPQNILVGADGVARLADFGIAKAGGRLQTTREGQIKGKSAYMAPEQLQGQAVDERTDLYAAAVCLWETLTATRLFSGEVAAEIMWQVLEKPVGPPSAINPQVGEQLDAVVLKGLARDPAQRFSTAHEMEVALERALSPAPAREVREWVESIAREALDARSRILSRIDASTIESAADAKNSIGPAANGTTFVAAAALGTHHPRGLWKRWLLRFAAALGALALGIFCFVWFGAKPNDAATTNLPAAPGASSQVAPLAPAVLPASASVAAEAPSDGLPTLVEDASAPRTRAPIRVRTPQRVSPSPQGKHCNPPYTLDPSGIRIAKPECL